MGISPINEMIIRDISTTVRLDSLVKFAWLVRNWFPI